MITQCQKVYEAYTEFNKEHQKTQKALKDKKTFFKQIGRKCRFL